MCQFISFFHNPLIGDVAVKDLTSHGNTEKELKLNPKIWREGHYLPNGEIVLRLNDDDRIDTVEYRSAFISKFPTFESFLNWTFDKVIVDGIYPGSLYLQGTQVKDLGNLKECGSLYLQGTQVKDLKIPEHLKNKIIIL